MPTLASDLVKAIALDHGVCIRPVPMRRTDLVTGESEVQYIPCGHTLASVCTPCAERNRKLRATQCREGWHLGVEPVIERADPDDEQRMWMGLRAQAQGMRDRAEKAGDPVEDLDAAIKEVDAEIERLRGQGLAEDRGATRPAYPLDQAAGRCGRPTEAAGRQTHRRQDLCRP